MDNSVYEVERDDYAAFIGQLNKSMMDVENYVEQNYTFLKIKSRKTGKHLSTRIISHEDGEEKYFIFQMPDDDERVAPKPIRKITLETKEEVQAFLNALGKLQEKGHDRTI